MIFYRYNIVIQLHKYVYSGELSEYFHSKIMSLLPNHGYITRYTSSDETLLPSVKKTVTRRQFLYNAINEWNKLPRTMRQIMNIKKLKSDVKIYFQRGKCWVTVFVWFCCKMFGSHNCSCFS